MHAHQNALRNAASSRRFFLVAVIGLLAGCDQAADTNSGLALSCETVSPISVIQGNGNTSDKVNLNVRTTGIVTRVEADGFFLQSAPADNDGNPQTSEALWVETTDLAQRGNLISIEGQVAELLTETSGETITALVGSYWSVCVEQTDLPEQNISIPVDSEPLEHMRITTPAGWQAVDVYGLRDQRLRIASERLFIPTQVVSPGQPANQLNARNTQRSLHIDWSDSGATLRSRLRAGDHLEAMTGIFDLRGRRPVLLSETAPAVRHAAAVMPAPEADSEQNIRVVGINVENLFNGDGQGGDFPTPRGAQTVQEYQQQLDQLVQAINALSPDILALMEVENDGYGDLSAIAQLTDALNQLPAHQWSYVRAPGERLGDDVIAVGLVYRSDRITASGASATLQTRPFDGLSRAPLAQRFRINDGELSFLVAVNHFKSKGGCPQGEGRNSDQGDGQGCWNEVRERSVLVLSDWLQQLQQNQDEPNALIIGDLNSYRMEDPIRTLIRAGWIDVTGQFLEPPVYSYRYFGEIGTLDYAFANPAMMEHIEDAVIWHINSDAAPGETVPSNSTGIARFSDHDPVIVDIRRF